MSESYISTITKKSEIVYTNIIKIGRLQAPRPFVEQETKRLNEAHKAELQSGKMNATHINQIVQNSVMQRNIIEATKEYLKNFIVIKFDESDVAKTIADLKVKQPQIPEASVKEIAERIIYENIIFSFLSKEWNIEVKDEDVNKALDEMYRATNQSIREYKTDKAKYEQFRKQVQVQKILAAINTHFKITAEVDLTQGPELPKPQPKS